MKIYNNAGELVYEFSTELSLQMPPSGMEVLGGALVPDEPGATATIHLLGTEIDLGWDGRNSGGQMVQSGTYMVFAELKDPIGSSTTYSAGVVVQRAPRMLRMSVYNSAGELVRLIEMDGAVPGGASPRVSGASFVAGEGALEVDCGNGTPLLRWDGKNERGEAVDAGSYLAKVEALAPGGTLQLLVQPVQLLRAKEALLLENALLAPNPAGPRTGRIQILLDGEAHGAVYNLAGERVATLGSCTGGLCWELGVAGDGIYWVVLEAKGQRRVLKAALMRGR
jgi:hypothetical protein